MVAIDGVIDIECSRWDRFVVGGLMAVDRQFEAHTNEDDFFRAILARRGTLWAHFGGRYDFLWFLQRCYEHRVQARIQMAGERISKLEVKGGPTLRDSYGLIPLPLCVAATDEREAAVELAGLPSYQLDLACTCLGDCGGYCRIGDPKHMPRVIEYLEQDCCALLMTLQSVEATFARHDIQLRGTIGSSAWATTRAWTGLEPMEWRSWQQYTFARKGYYGGRCEVIEPEASSGYRYDLNSAYPWGLREVDLPVPPYRRVSGDMAARCYARGKPGVYQAKVNVRQNIVLPTLPWRYRDRIYFPIGDIHGTWSDIELRRAESTRQATIIEFIGAIVFAEGEQVLRPVIDKLWELREGSHGAWRNYWKLLANALVGKLAQRPEQAKIHVCPDAGKIKFCPGGGSCSPDHCSGRCGRWEPMDQMRQIWKAPIWAIPDSAYIHWAAAVNAHVRLALKQQLQSGFGAVYCDTDSVYSTHRRHLNIGDELGQWKCEGRFQSFTALGPKLYSYWEPDSNEWIVKAAGMQGITRKKFEVYRDGGQLSFDAGVKPLRSAVKTGRVFQRQFRCQQRRNSAPWIGGRRLDTSCGITMPVTCSEIMAHVMESAYYEHQ